MKRNMNKALTLLLAATFILTTLLLPVGSVWGATTLGSEFEGDTCGWTPAQDKPCDGASSILGTGPDGSGALKLTGLSAGMRIDYGAGYTLKKGSTYTMTYWVKTSSPATMMVAMEPGWSFDAMVKSDVMGEDFSDAVYLWGNSPGGSWQKVTNTFTVSDIKSKSTGSTLDSTRTSLSIRFNEPVAEVYIDKVYIVEDGAAEPGQIEQVYLSGYGTVGQTVLAVPVIPGVDEVNCTYQWQSSPNGESWSDIPGAIDKTYVIGSNDSHLRVGATISGKATVYSNTLKAGAPYLACEFMEEDEADWRTWGFEGDVEGTYWESAGIADGAGPDGGSAYQIKNLESDGSTYIQYLPGVTLKNGSSYTLSYWAKAEEAMDAAVCIEGYKTPYVITAAGVVDQPAIYSFFKQNAGWQLITYSFTVNNIKDKTTGERADGMPMELQLLFKGSSASVTIDKLYLIENNVGMVPRVDRVEVSGLASVGSTLTAKPFLFYADEGGCAFQWQKLGEGWEDISDANTKTYAIEAEGSYRAAVSIAGGAPVYSAPVLVGDPQIASDFETENDWTVDSTSSYTACTLSPGDGPDGSGALKATGTGDNFYLSYPNHIRLKKGSSYEITYWVKASTATQTFLCIEPGFSFDAKIKIKGGNLDDGIYGGFLGAGPGWQKGTFAFTVEDIQDKSTGESVDTTQSRLALLSKTGTDELYIDKIYVIEDGVGASPRVDQVTLSGAATAGKTLTAVVDVFHGDASMCTYQWQISDDGQQNWANIPNATKSKYTGATGDVGKYVRAGVAIGGAAVYSAPVQIAAGGGAQDETGKEGWILKAEKTFENEQPGIIEENELYVTSISPGSFDGSQYYSIQLKTDSGAYPACHMANDPLGGNVVYEGMFCTESDRSDNPDLAQWHINFEFPDGSKEKMPLAWISPKSIMDGSHNVICANAPGTWYRIWIDINLREGTYHVTVSDETGKEIGRSAQSPIPGNGDFRTAKATFNMALANPVNGTELKIDNLRAYQVPLPKVVNVTGFPVLGETMTARADILDIDAPEGTTVSYQWQSSQNGTDGFANISGATNETYVPVEADVGNYVRVSAIQMFEGQPVGDAVYSAAQKILSEIPRVYDYYVAPNGNDSSDGTIENPFATLEKAKSAVRALLASGANKPVTVYFREGTYPVSRSVQFNASDSGTAEAPVTYRAYEDEKVRFIGGKVLDSTKIQPVTDQAVLDRVLSEHAKPRLVKLDLGAQGISNIPALPDEFGFGFSTVAQPVEIYYNGTALSQSRWPNEGFLKTTKVKIEGSDPANSPVTVTYVDEEDHTKLWNLNQINDLYLCGFISYDWAGVTQKIAGVDPEKKTLTTTGPTSFEPDSSNQNHKLYFFNLLEEIDQPGESYIDRENNVVYFYPYDDYKAAAPEMIISTLDQPMVSMNKTSYVTFDGLEFGATRNDAFSTDGVDHISFLNCEIAKTSRRAITLKGNHCLIENCHIYNLGAGGIYVQGGDRQNMISSGNIIRNNRLHYPDRVYNSYVPLIQVSYDVGTVIQNNEIYDSKHELVAFESNNDVKLIYNDIHDGVRQASDMGAVYWGRNPTALGIEIKYNYFHDMGNAYGGYGQQSVFWDDGAPGPDMFGNIFYRGTLTADQGGTTNNHSYAIKTHGGQFSRITNNIIVDAPTAYLNQTWGDWYEWVYDLEISTKTRDHDVWANQMLPSNFDSDAWKNHYKDTQWSFLNQYFNLADKAKLDAMSDSSKIQFVNEHKPPLATNTFDGNVVAKVDTVITGDSIQDTKTYQIADGDLKSSFVDYGKDFKLTDAALAKVRETNPGFENIPTEKIGLKPATRDGKTFYVGGQAPAASNLVLSGTSVGATAKVSYTYADPDGDREGYSSIRWFVSDKKDGTYTRLDNMGREMYIDNSLSGLYLKCEVTPTDCRMIEGETITSAVMAIEGQGAADKRKLWSAIEQADSLLSNAVVGSGQGEYPQAAVDALRTAAEAARTTANTTGLNQFTVDRATAALQDAIDAFYAERISNMQYQSLKPLLADTANWRKIAGGDPVFENGSLIIPDGGYVSYVGSAYKNKVFTFKLKFEKENAGDALSSAMFFRLGNPEDWIWGAGNTGYLLWMKDNTLEYQCWKPEQTLVEFENKYIKVGTEHELSVGVYDIDNNKVKYIAIIDGVTVYETESDGLYGEEGYLAFCANGAKMTISPVDVDKSGLEAALTEARALRSAAEVGDGYGQFKSTAEIDTAITEAAGKRNDDNLVQYDIDRAVSVLRRAVNAFAASANTEAEVTGNKTVTIHYSLPQAVFHIKNGASLQLIMDPTKAQPNIVTDTATSAGLVKMDIPAGTILNGTGWNGSFQAPLFGTGPSKTINNAIIGGVYKIGADNVLHADRAVRIVLPGQKGKTVAYLENGKYKTISKTLSEDSQTAADAALLPAGGALKITSGEDIIIWTTLLTEFVTYDKTPPPTYYPTYQPSPGGTGGNTPITGPGNPVGVSTPAPNNAGRFTDIGGHWAQNDIEVMAAKGIVVGVTPDSFEPERAVTRAEFATLVVKTLNITSNTPADFADAGQSDWFYPYVNAAANAGLIVGYDGYFRPDDRITREEMAVIVAKAYAYAGKEAASGGIDKFTDKETIAQWAYESVDTVTSAGLIAGMTPDTFEASANTTRAQAVAVLRRFLDAIQ